MRRAGHVARTGEIEAIYGVMVLKLERRNCMEYAGDMDSFIKKSVLRQVHSLFKTGP